MQTHTELGTIEDILATSTPDIRQLFHTLRHLIGELHATAVEVIRAGDRAASYGWGPKKMSEAYAYLMPHAKYVNLGFYLGAKLPDPEGLLEGTGKKLRHVKVRTENQAKSPAIRTLLLAAQEERRQALDLPKA